MEIILIIVFIFIGVVIGLVVGFLSGKNKMMSLLQEEQKMKVKFETMYNESLKSIEEQKKFVGDANQALRDAFSSLSNDVVKSNNQSFLDLAKTSLEKYLNESKSDLEKRQQAIDTVVKPLNESLEKFDRNIKEMEKAREGAYSEIKTYLGTMQGTTEKLQKETNTLVSALKNSHVRGRYGEIGLRRIVEFAGMSEFCDFTEQESVTTEDGKLRPDLIVKMPGKRQIIVDSKVPLNSYIAAFETTDENERKELMKKHALAVKDHLKKLSAKAYWSQFAEAPDYVVLYMQIESSFGAALEADPAIIEEGINNRVIFATPTTLITLLKTVAYSWQQMKIADNIYQIRDAGVELFSRVRTLLDHLASMGKHIKSATEDYNKLVGSVESRFIPQVKKLKEIGGSAMNKEIPKIEQIETSVRQLNEYKEEDI